MALEVGTRLGPYEILALLGAGGMGEVYRARDGRLGRTVAVKVIRYTSPDDSELRERLEREARAAALLTHPHICTLHDVGRDRDVDYLVMEFVHGETLAARLERAPLSLDETLTLGVQLADALDTAHRHGIVHRDLKPSNVMLTSGGAKLLDFGLARSREEVFLAHFTGERAAPTATLTARGTILGTLNYMSPEQLQHQEVDARADIFALGAVLYESLTARRAFDGSSPASVIAAVLERQPPALTTLQPLTPPALDHLVQRCLVKDVDNRWQNARDLFHELGWIQRALGHGAHDPTLGWSGVDAVARRTRWRLVPPWLVLALAVLTAVAAVWYFAVRPDSTPAAVRRLTVVVPDGERIALARTTPAGLGRVAIALSPDGSTLAYAGRRLYVRRLDSFVAQELPKTEGAYAPVFSPDARWIAFVSGGTLKKVALSGGDPLVLCEVQNAMALAWGEAGIVILDNFASRLAVANPDGGAPIALGPGGYTLGLLPGGDDVLVAGALSNNPDRGVVHVVSLLTGQRTPLSTRGVQPRYLSEGFLTVGRGGTLFAVPFDLPSLQVVGLETAVEHGIRMEVPGTAQYVLSAEGTLAYIPGTTGWNSQLVWVAPGGAETPINLPVQPYGSFRISPDGRRLAFVQGGTTDDIWVLDLGRGTSRRLTQQGDNSYPVWTPDGSRIAFRRVSGGRESIWWTAVDGNGAEARLTDEAFEDRRPYSVSPDGRLLAFARGKDVVFLELFGNHAARPVLSAAHTQNMPVFSPNGRALAHTSDESGRTEIYVRRLSDDRRTQVSIDGGEEPVWTRDGRRLFFRNGDRWMVSELGRTGIFGAPKVVVQGPYLNVPGLSYDVAGDGRLLLMRGIEGDVDASTIHIVSNWASEVRRLSRQR